MAKGVGGRIECKGGKDDKAERNAGREEEGFKRKTEELENTIFKKYQSTNHCR
jgi:hypothetical protein